MAGKEGRRCCSGSEKKTGESTHSEQNAIWLRSYLYVRGGDEWVQYRIGGNWGKQEQTKFDDLRRGITEDWQRMANFQRTLSKSTKKLPISSNSRFWPFLTKWPENSNLNWTAQHNLGVPEIFNFIKFSVWALLIAWIWHLNLFWWFLSDFCFWPFLTFKWPQNSNLTWSAPHNFGLPEIFNLIKFSGWALFGP